MQLVFSMYFVVINQVVFPHEPFVTQFTPIRSFLVIISWLLYDIIISFNLHLK